MWRLIVKQIPNTITCCNLLAGCVAIIFAFSAGETFGSLTGRECAYIAIAAAALFDFCDGAAARLLKAYSAIGKELDSLADLVSFGVAPALLLFNLTEGAARWCALMIAAFGALRLARFNVDDRQATTFIGLPIPANAIFWIGYTAWISVHGVPGAWAVIVAEVLVSLLMVSDLRMFSLKFKNFDWRENFSRYVIIAAAVFFVWSNGIEGLMWTIILYLLISAVVGRLHRQLEARNKQ